jgi:DNA polymerase I-like protein with 3'-5' exonuclease and polymerase domains
MYCDTGPWKLAYRGKEIEEKGSFGVSAEDLPAYNAADVRLDAIAWAKMQGDLASEQKVYKADMAMADLLRRAQQTGWLVDVERKKQLSVKMRHRENALLGLMRLKADRLDFNPKAYAHIRAALYEDFGQRVWKLTPKGKASTDQAVLEALRGQQTPAGQLADMILRWRSARDVRVEYLDNLVLDKSNRVHAGFKPARTETGRPACKGPNLLNTPRCEACASCGILLIDGAPHRDTCKKPSVAQPESQIRDVYICPKGKKLVYYDLSQSEMRFSAFLSGDENFIASCKGDVHAGNAMVIFPEAAEVLKSDPKGKGKRFRDITKNCGFAITYLAKPDKIFSYLRGKGFPVTMPQCEAIYDRLHSTYRQYYRYVDNNLAFCQKNGYLRSCFTGRIRWLGWCPKPTTVANYPIQSGVADIMNRRLVEFDKIKPSGAELLIYAYDSATYEVPLGAVSKMEKLIREQWAEPVKIPHNGLSFVQAIDYKVGERWSDFG